MVQSQCVLTILCLAMLGCAVEDDDRKPIFPVHGQLTYRGQPMNKALISFHPLNDSSLAALRPNAEADVNGQYVLTTYITSDGAPAGDYTVTIYWPGPLANPAGEDTEQLAPDQLRGLYATQATSQLRAGVQERDNVIDFTLP